MNTDWKSDIKIFFYPFMECNDGIVVVLKGQS